MAAQAAPQFIYYNVLTGTAQIPDPVLAALRTITEPPKESLVFQESDLPAYLSNWPSPWALLDFKKSPDDIDTLRREADFLQSIGFGVYIDPSETKMLVSTSIVKELYGPAAAEGGALFQFPAQSGLPKVSVAKIQGLIRFLKDKTAPLYIRRAQKRIDSFPDTIWEGAKLRQEVRDLERMIRDLEALIPNPASTVGKPA